MPLLLGFGARLALPDLAAKSAKTLSLIATIFLVIGVLIILVKSAPAILSLIGNGTVLVALIFVVSGLVIGHLFGGPDPDDRAALAVSTVSRHPGMALAIATVNFPDHKLAPAAIALYLLINAVITTVYLKKIRQWVDQTGSGSTI